MTSPVQRCTTCGATSAAGLRLCSTCGRPLVQPTTPVSFAKAPPVAAPQAGTPPATAPVSLAKAPPPAPPSQPPPFPPPPFQPPPFQPPRAGGGRGGPLLWAAAGAVGLLLVAAAAVAGANAVGGEDERRAAPAPTDPGPVPSPSPPPPPAPSPDGGGDEPVPEPVVTTPVAEPEPAPVVPRPLVPVSATATCTSPPAQDTQGLTVTYEPARVLDGSPETAWRCPGSAVGERLSFTFATPVTLTTVGLVPGYDKVDPVDDIDRFTANRTVTAVSWQFDDGTVVRQDLGVPTRQLTEVRLDAPVRTQTVVMQILATGNDGAEVDHTPVSDVAFTGG